MIKIVIVFFTLFTSNVFADESYSSNTGGGIQSIYWLNKTQGGAIVYAKHHGFIQLKNFIDTAILTSHEIAKSELNIEAAEQLLLMLPTAKKWLVVYFTADQLSYDGRSYLVDPNTLKALITMNNYRINKGDLISTLLLNRAKKSFGVR